MLRVVLNEQCFHVAIVVDLVHLQLHATGMVTTMLVSQAVVGLVCPLAASIIYTPKIS